MIKEYAEYKIAILGFGTVGKSVYEIIKNESNEYIDNIDVLYVYEREDKLESLKNTYDDVEFTSDINEIMEDDDVDIIVECLGGVDYSFQAFKLAVKYNKDFVTSNKALLALKYEDMKNMARDNFINLYYEATVMGGVPIFRNINNIKKVDTLVGFLGIINGTTNFILSKMEKENIDYSKALKMAEKKGYAEKDASFDVDGIDAKYKTFIILNYMYDRCYDLDDIVNFGISNITIDDINYARNNNKVIKLIAACNIETGFVMPMFINDDDIMANTSENTNILEIHSDNLEKTTIIGQGAGGLPTAHSVVSDIVDITCGNMVFSNDFEKAEIKNDVVSDYYVRTKKKIEGFDIEKINEDTYIMKNAELKKVYEYFKDIDDLFIAKM